MIIAPSFNGKHNTTQYGKLYEELREFFKNENLKLDCDFLHFEEELIFYFDHIFIKAYYTFNCNKKIVFRSNDRRVLRRVRKILKKILVISTPIKMSNYKYYIESQ